MKGRRLQSFLDRSCNPCRWRWTWITGPLTSSEARQHLLVDRKWWASICGSWWICHTALHERRSYASEITNVIDFPQRKMFVNVLVPGPVSSFQVIGMRCWNIEWSASNAPSLSRTFDEKHSLQVRLAPDMFCHQISFSSKSESEDSGLSKWYHLIRNKGIPFTMFDTSVQRNGWCSHTTS